MRWIDVVSRASDVEIVIAKTVSPLNGLGHTRPTDVEVRGRWGLKGALLGALLLGAPGLSRTPQGIPGPHKDPRGPLK